MNELFNLISQLDIGSAALGLGGLGGAVIMLQKLYAIFANDGLQIKGATAQTDVINLLQVQLERFAEINKELSSEVESLRKSNQQSENEKAEIRAESLEIKATLDRVQEENKLLRKELENLRQQIDGLTEVITKLTLRSTDKAQLNSLIPEANRRS